MKKYILGLTIISMLTITSTATAMEKEKKQMPQTSLSDKQVSELRQAIIDYKKDKSRTKQEKIINKYRDKYPNDPFVKAKLNEKVRFDNPQQPVKKPKAEKTPIVKQPVKEEQPKKQVAEGKPNIRITNRESKTIEVHTQYFSHGLRDDFKDDTKIIKPNETVLIYVPEADRRDMTVEVYTLNSAGDKFSAQGIHTLEKIKKGEITDLIFEDNHKYYPLVRVQYKSIPDEYYQGNKSAPHLYEIRNGVTIDHLPRYK